MNKTSVLKRKQPVSHSRQGGWWEICNALTTEVIELKDTYPYELSSATHTHALLITYVLKLPPIISRFCSKKRYNNNNNNNNYNFLLSLGAI